MVGHLFLLVMWTRALKRVTQILTFKGAHLKALNTCELMINWKLAVVPCGSLWNLKKKALVFIWTWRLYGPIQYINYAIIM